jgi:hypothetical protein
VTDVRIFRNGGKDEDAFTGVAYMPIVCFCQNEASGAKGLHESLLGARYLGKNNDLISCHEVFAIFSGNFVAPARHLAVIKPSGRHIIAYRKQSVTVNGIACSDVKWTALERQSGDHLFTLDPALLSRK